MRLAVQFSKISDHMRLRADWLLAGRLDELVADFVYPVPIELLSTRLIVHNPDEGRAMLALWHDALVRNGVVALKSDVVAVGVPRRGRFRIWVEYHEIVPGQQEDRFTSILYYCSRTLSGIRIEMVCFPHLSLPELDPQFAAMALSA
ncbi:MAG: hypothetical protein C0524_00265 [Rhodobacter sp.]|nr:hypothetical protein [Rhodobacter sp.]